MILVLSASRSDVTNITTINFTTTIIITIIITITTIIMTITSTTLVRGPEQKTVQESGLHIQHVGRA